MIQRGEKEKERRDKHAREESLEVGMKVLLKNKVKRKGQPKYDPKPYTITELHGRQATLKRGTKKIKRETQMFKRFFEAPPSKENSNNTTQRDNCEEGWRKTGSKGGEQDTNRQASNMVTGTQASTTAFEPAHNVNQLIDFLLVHPWKEDNVQHSFMNIILRRQNTHNSGEKGRPHTVRMS